MASRLSQRSPIRVGPVRQPGTATSQRKHLPELSHCPSALSKHWQPFLAKGLGPTKAKLSLGQIPLRESNVKLICSNKKEYIFYTRRLKKIHPVQKHPSLARE
jgi:hypothetical protein